MEVLLAVSVLYIIRVIAVILKTLHGHFMLYLYEYVEFIIVCSFIEAATRSDLVLRHHCMTERDVVR